MNIDFITMDEYLEEKKEMFGNKVFYYSTIVGVLLIMLIVYCTIKNKDSFYENVFFVQNDRIVLLIDYNKLEHLISNNYLIYKEKKYYYSIKEINLIEENLIYEVSILLNYNGKFYENVLYKYQIFICRENMLNYFGRIIKGEIDERS